MKTVDGLRQLTIQSRYDDNERLVVSVEDTGIGLPENQAGQIFNAFFTQRSTEPDWACALVALLLNLTGASLGHRQSSPRSKLYFTLAVDSDVSNCC